MQRRERILGALATTLFAAHALAACTDRELKPLQACLVSTLVEEVQATGITAVDLLFVVDNSHSMQEEQASLRREFPKLIQVLTTGERPGQAPFSPVKDLHLAVVSSDMGLLGIQGVPGCEGFGDDGIMNTAPGASVPGCQTGYPRFLTYLEGASDPMRAAQDFACISTLGTDGCGFEQPLESALKALWPSADGRVRFLGDAMGFGELGHGDVENLGFLRGDDTPGSSLLAIVVVSDEEDCSSADTSHFVPEAYLAPDSPLRAQDLNLRCFHNPQNLYAIDRYVNGFREVRPGREKLVVFGAIVGVPPDLVDASARAGVDLADPAGRDAYYDGILADARMQETPDPTRPPGEGNLTPSCNTTHGVAYPPRRIVEVARRFGEQGVVQSICENDFGPAMDAILTVIVDNFTLACLPRPLVRDVDGLVGCDVVWELPPPGTAAPGTPVACGERPYLATPDDRAGIAKTGGAVCNVQQLPVRADTVQASTDRTDGWYYDDFSPEVARRCSAAAPGRVAFTGGAQPEPGIVVKLACLDEAPHLSSTRTDLAPGVHQPAVGDGCDQVASGTALSGDAACAVTLASGATDTSMFCHPEWNVCVRACATDADCPAAWACDARHDTLATASRAMCVNPTCGEAR